MTITDKAADKAKELLASEGKENWGIRVYVAGENCCGLSYGLNVQEKEMPNDEVIEKNGLKVFMDKQTLETLSGKQLEYHTEGEAEGFILTGGISSCGSTCDTCR
jgi:iron-sulfur cluster assembly accessory protein